MSKANFNAPRISGWQLAKSLLVHPSKSSLDVDFILKGVHIFPGAYVSTEVKNTWMIKAMIQYHGMDSIELLNAFLEDFEGWTKRDFAS